jgi:hypothetical protein
MFLVVLSFFWTAYLFVVRYVSSITSYHHPYTIVVGNRATDNKNQTATIYITMMMSLSRSLALRRSLCVMKRQHDFAAAAAVAGSAEILLKPWPRRSSNSMLISQRSATTATAATTNHQFGVGGHCFVSPYRYSARRASSSIAEYDLDPNPADDPPPAVSSSSSLSASSSSSSLPLSSSSLSPATSDTPAAAAAPAETASSSLTVEEQYSRKTPLEHVLLRPGMYVGPNERLPLQECWVLDPPIPPPSNELLQLHPTLLSAYASSTRSSDTSTTTAANPPPSWRMVKKEFGLVPALLKVFGELLLLFLFETNHSVCKVSSLKSVCRCVQLTCVLFLQIDNTLLY